MRTEIKEIEAGVERLIGIIEADLNKRGVLYLDRAQYLLELVKRMKVGIAETEAAMPMNFYSATWSNYRKRFDEFEKRLTRIIRGTALPLEDSERP